MSEDSKHPDAEQNAARPISPPLQRGATAPVAGDPEGIMRGRSNADLSAGELLTEIGAQASLLVKKQVDLAKTELRADLSHEIAMVGGLSVAALALFLTLNLLLMAGVFALASALAFPGWLAALMVSGFTLLTAIAAGMFGWNKRIRSPLGRTRKALKEDVQWTKERLA
jgi:hypothetical protein